MPEILWLHVLADAMIALAYFSIPLALYQFAKKRDDIPFRMLFLLFASFITLCGITHVFGIIVQWVPLYGVEGLIKLATGIISIVTAFIIWKKLPLALTLPSPAHLQLMNQELKNVNATIEQKVEQRTNELNQVNERLHLAMKLAEDANAAKTEFLANMSHELRTPMNAIIGIAAILNRDDQSEQEKKGYLNTLQLSANALLQIINDLLDISKIEANELELESTVFSMEAVMEEVCSIMQVRAEEKRIALTLDYKKDTGFLCLGDPLRVRQIITNLVSNAIKFTDRGSVTVNVLTEKQSQAMVQYTITVIDTGVGMNMQQQARIFEKFVQADSSISRKYGGTGLGLAISRYLVELLGGTIHVESKVGEGSRFTVTLPLKTVSVEQLPAEEGSAEAPRYVAQHVLGRRILLVEDYEENILVATTILKGLGYAVEVAKNGQEAVDRLLAEPFDKPFDLVLMDVQMPVMDGYSATKAIRTAESAGKLPHLPIIGMTAHALTGDREKCLQAGMDDYMPKPFNPEDLESILLKYLA